MHPGFQWAEPLKGNELTVERIGEDLKITGLVPVYKSKDSPCDLIDQYEIFAKQLAIGRQREGMQSPEMSLANADTDDKLIAFVRQFGPVVAKCAIDTRMIPEENQESHAFRRLIAHQNVQELRSEQAVYRAALHLIMRLNQPDYDYASARELVKTIAANIRDWPRQWEREQSLRKVEPIWLLRPNSLERIEDLSSLPQDCILPAEVDGRIVICELLNSFPSTVFPNFLEMHSSIKFGIRPLLYSILRRQFLHPRGFSICLNTQCRKFFNIERARQQFCSPECSLHHRQRVYWQERGSKLRKKRIAQRKKKGK